jgi:hypothetical protein
MTEANARFIMMEIHRIGNYENLIIEYTGELKRIRQRLDDLASLPSSGNFDKIKVENSHVETSTKINDLLSDEQEYIECREKLQARLDLALSYKKQVIAQTNSDPFMTDYINRMSYKKLAIKHGWENPYEHMISVMRGLTIRI